MKTRRREYLVSTIRTSHFVCYRSNPRKSHGFHKINDRNQCVDNETRVGNCFVKANGLKNLFATSTSLCAMTLCVFAGVLNGYLENA